MTFLRTCLGFLFALTVLVSEAVTTASITIGGKITKVTDKKTATYHLSEAAFLAMPQTTIRTATTWTPVTDFTGVNMVDLMKLVGATGKIAEFHTLDNYITRVPVTDFAKYGVILARKMNHVPLKTSNFGPYFLIYPRDAHAKELKTPTGDSKFPWQVNRIIFR